MNNASDDKTLAEAIETEVKVPPPSVGEKRKEIGSAAKDQSKSGSAASKKSNEHFSSPKLGENEPGALSSSSDPALKMSNDLTAELRKDADQAQEATSTTKPKTELIPAKPLETMFQIKTPAAEGKSEEYKLPHMQAPPYVHHFDTYTLVKDLQKGGFTEAQSTTLMKAVRGLLAVNMNVAKQGLVGKSDVENVRTLNFPRYVQDDPF